MTSGSECFLILCEDPVVPPRAKPAFLERDGLRQRHYTKLLQGAHRPVRGRFDFARSATLEQFLLLGPPQLPRCLSLLKRPSFAEGLVPLQSKDAMISLKSEALFFDRVLNSAHWVSRISFALAH